MPLTKEQIESLFAFTKKKSVHYYDLQVELVDHLASSIEEEMEADVKLTFDAALQKIYSRFGLFGFAHVVQERERALEKRGRKLFWKVMRSYLTIPKVALTFSLFAGAYLLAPFFSGLLQRILIAAILIYTGSVGIYTVMKQRKKDIKPLLLTLSTNYFIPLHGWELFIYPSIVKSFTSPINSILFASLVTAITIFHLAAVQIYKQVYQKAKELYPEAFSVA